MGDRWTFLVGLTWKHHHMAEFMITDLQGFTKTTIARSLRCWADSAHLIT